MSSPLADIASSSGGACPAEAQPAKPRPTPKTPSQLEMRALMEKLDSLLLLESTEFYCSSWEKFKIKVT